MLALSKRGMAYMISRRVFLKSVPTVTTGAAAAVILPRETGDIAALSELQWNAALDELRLFEGKKSSVETVKAIIMDRERVISRLRK